MGTHVTLLVEATVPLDFAAIDARLVEHLWRAGPDDIRGWKGQIRPLRDFGPVGPLGKYRRTAGSTPPPTKCGDGQSTRDRCGESGQRGCPTIG